MSCNLFGLERFPGLHFEVPPFQPPTTEHICVLKEKQMCFAGVLIVCIPSASPQTKSELVTPPVSNRNVRAQRAKKDPTSRSLCEAPRKVPPRDGWHLRFAGK